MPPPHGPFGIVLLFFAAAAPAAALTWIWIALAPRLGLLDAPNPIVPQHRRATASLGGVPVALATLLIALPALLIWPGAELFTNQLPASVAWDTLLAWAPAAVGFLLLGAVDDVLRLAPLTKLVAQIALAALAAASGLIAPISGDAILDSLATLLLIVTSVNAVNLTDVCDGLVSTLSMVALGAASLLWPELAWCAAPAAGACLGFLVFNAPPARIFLGDAGSHWLGFLLIALPISATRVSAADYPTRAPLFVALQGFLLLGPFLFELLLLIVARSRRGIPVWNGSPDHYALRMQAAGRSRAVTVGIAALAAAALAWIALIFPLTTPIGRVVLLATIGLLAPPAFLAVLQLPAPSPADRPRANR